MNSKFCGKCGMTNAEQTKFCMQCGENLEVAAPSAGNYAQSTAVSPNQFQPSPFTLPPPNNFSAAQNSFTPPSPGFVAPNNFASPNAGFQPPPFQQSPSYQSTPFATTVASQKTGIGSKIMSALGVIVVGLFLFLKFGFIILRAGSLGGIGLVAVIFVILAVFGLLKFIRRTRN